MKVRLALLLLLATVLIVPACSNNTTSVTGPTPAPSFAGVWTGTSIDSTGSAFGTGLGIGTTSMTWTLTQNGTQVSGAITFPGILTLPGQAAITVTGTASGNTLNFTVAIPAGTVTTLPTCSGTATGTMTINDAATSMTGTYSGTSTCNGAFANGQITLTKQ